MKNIVKKLKFLGNKPLTEFLSYTYTGIGIHTGMHTCRLKITAHVSNSVRMSQIK